MTDTTPVDSITTSDNRVSPTITYILRNSNNKYYCGKTNNLSRRMKEHSKDSRMNPTISKDKWKGYSLIWFVNGDHEKKIKIFGVRRFYHCITTGVVS